MQYVPRVFKNSYRTNGRGLLLERIIKKKEKKVISAPPLPVFCSGFTNTTHVNEAGSISVVPGAWIVFGKKKKREREREKDRGIMFFFRANTKAV